MVQAEGREKEREKEKEKKKTLRCQLCGGWLYFFPPHPVTIIHKPRITTYVYKGQCFYALLSTKCRKGEDTQLGAVYNPRCPSSLDLHSRSLVTGGLPGE